VLGGDPHACRGGARPQREEGHAAESRELGCEGSELLERDATAGNGLREQKLDRSALLLAREGTCSASDPGDEQEQRNHHREQLGPEVSRRRAEVELAAEARERLQRLRIGLVELEQRLVRADRGPDSSDDGDVADQADAPPHDTPAGIEESPNEDASAASLNVSPETLASLTPHYQPAAHAAGCGRGSGLCLSADHCGSAAANGREAAASAASPPGRVSRQTLGEAALGRTRTVEE
jgi:hypothetical protein